MMNRLLVHTSISAVLLTTVGCSSLFGDDGYFNNKTDDYLRADVIDPMKVPEGIETTQVEQLFVIPPVADDELIYADKFVTPRPVPMSDSLLEDSVKIQSLGDRRWVLVNAQPSQVWPQARAFLDGYGLEVVYTDARNGIMETSWLKFQDDVTKKDKYRIKIDAGVQPQTTEVHVLHMSMPWGVPGSGQVNWPARSINPERESWMLDELASSMVTDNATAQSASLLAQTIGVSDRVRIINVDGEAVLSLKLDYPRAWATVQHSLESDKFSLWEEDDTVGVFYLGYDPHREEPEEVIDMTGKKRGLMGGIFDFGGMLDFNSSEPDVEETKPEPVKTSKGPYELREVLANLDTSEKVQGEKLFASVNSADARQLTNLPGYLVVLRGWDGEVSVRVRDAHGRQVDQSLAKRVLKEIRLNLI